MNEEHCKWCNKEHSLAFMCAQKFMYELIIKIYAVGALENSCNPNNHVLNQELAKARDLVDEQILLKEF
jgi:hypothetical protein